LSAAFLVNVHQFVIMLEKNKMRCRFIWL